MLSSKKYLGYVLDEHLELRVIMGDKVETGSEDP